MTDALEEQGLESTIVQLSGGEGVDADLLEQLRIYELVLQHEDEGALLPANARFVCLFTSHEYLRIFSVEYS